jgi:hypothetical protein
MESLWLLSCLVGFLHRDSCLLIHIAFESYFFHSPAIFPFQAKEKFHQYYFCFVDGRDRIFDGGFDYCLICF